MIRKIDIKRNPELVYGLRNFIGNAVKFAKLGSEIIGGKGGGGRADFAQAGGLSENKIDEAFEKLKVLI